MKDAPLSANNTAFSMKIKNICLLILIIALSLSLIVQWNTDRGTIMTLESKVRLVNSEKRFYNFMQATFGELGILVMKEPQRARLYTLPANWIELDYVAPKDIRSQVSGLQGEPVPSNVATKVYNEFSHLTVDDQYSYFAPTPITALEIVRNGDTVLLFSGIESNTCYFKVFVFDFLGNCKDLNRTWVRYNSGTIDDTMACQRRKQ